MTLEELQEHVNYANNLGSAAESIAYLHLLADKVILPAGSNPLGFLGGYKFRTGQWLVHINSRGYATFVPV
jgi:hypothetical protein